jgi:hypothetical protein
MRRLSLLVLFIAFAATAPPVSYEKIYHAGLVEGDSLNAMLDVGASWDEAKLNRATKLGKSGQRRNLTGGSVEL